jgi:hypothetical protein
MTRNGLDSNVRREVHLERGNERSVISRVLIYNAEDRAVGILHERLDDRTGETSRVGGVANR